MNRSGWVKGAKLLQILLGLGLVALSAFLLFLSFSAEMKHHDGDGAGGGLRIAAEMVAASLAMLAGAYGLWKEKMWGWWTAFLVDLGWLGILIYRATDDGWNNPDTDLFPLAVSICPLLMLLLPGVRKYYWRQSGSALPGSGRQNTDAVAEKT